MTWFWKIIATIGFWRVKPEKFRSGKTLKAYGRVNTWASGSFGNLKSDLARCKADGIDGYHIELAGWGDSSSVWTDKNAMNKVKKTYKKLIRMARALGLWVFVSVVNDNMGKGKYGDRGPKLEQVYGSAVELAKFVKKCGKDNIMVQPVAETQTSAGKRFDAECLGIFQGWTTVYNGSGGRPGGTNGCTFRAMHPAAISKITPREYNGAIVSSDHGLIIREMCYGLDGKIKTDKMHPFYIKCKEASSPMCVFYHFLYNGHDKNGIDAFGKA